MSCDENGMAPGVHLGKLGKNLGKPEKNNRCSPNFQECVLKNLGGSLGVHSQERGIQQQVAQENKR